MLSFFISLKSEFYKSRKSLAFWASILLPLIICGLITIGFYTSSEKILKMNYPTEGIWFQFLRQPISLMGMLILPFYVIFMAFSVNNIEHKNDTWKMLFSQPLNKFSIYAAKFLYGIILIFICLFLFAAFGLFFGLILSKLVPAFKFQDYSPVNFLWVVYLKLFLSALGIYSIQFILSLIWADFLKPMGIGFVLTIVGLITILTKWEYAIYIPYGSPTDVVSTAFGSGKILAPPFPIFIESIWVSLICSMISFIAGYYILSQRNIK